MLEKDFVKSWVEKIKEGMMKSFPNDFLNGVSAAEIPLPGKTLVLGPELFGSFEVTDSKGNPFLQTDNFLKVKYYLYANRTTPNSMLFPDNEKDMMNTVKEYEKYLDSLVALVEKDFKKQFPESKSMHHVTNQIFNILNLQRY